MKFRIELENELMEDEIIIRCSQITPEIQKIQKAIADISLQTPKISFFKGDTEFYLPVKSILFFETSAQGIEAHTSDDVYLVKYKLYELEDLLPNYFLRVSKSTILNTDKIFSINKSLSSSSLVEFYQSHKQVYVSRNYFKSLKKKLEERR